MFNANENDKVKAMKIDEARGNMRKGPFALIQSGEYFEDEKLDNNILTLILHVTISNNPVSNLTPPLSCGE